MPDSSQCDSIANQIVALQREKTEFQQELSQASPLQKPMLIAEIREISLEIARKRQALLACLQQNPPPPRPDLLAANVLLTKNHATRELGVAALIRNIGQGNATGPFRIDLAATLIQGGVIRSFVRAFEVPASVTIFGEMVFTTEAALLPDDVAISNEYATESMTVPLGYMDENPSCRYSFEFIVDSDKVLAETNEANNHFKLDTFFVTPTVLQRTSPFVIESLAAFQTSPLQSKDKSKRDG
jgi:hypothetical protein